MHDVHEVVNIQYARLEWILTTGYTPVTFKKQPDQNPMSRWSD